MPKPIAICSCFQRVFCMESFFRHDEVVQKYPAVHKWIVVEDLIITQELKKPLGRLRMR